MPSGASDLSGPGTASAAPSAGARPHPVVVAGLLLALAAYGFLLARHVGAVAGGSDSSGYLNHARLLATGRLHVAPRAVAELDPRDAPPLLYLPLGFAPAADGRGMVPTYPPGLPLQIAGLAAVVGWAHAGDVAAVLNALLGLAATYALGRQLGLGPAASALGALMVGLSPLYLYMALQAMSDVPSLAWTTLAVLAALRSRERAAWAVAGGAALAMAVLLRPTNLLAAVPVALALPRTRRAWLLLAAGGLPGAGFLAAHGYACYGRPWATGYGRPADLFSLGVAGATVRAYGRWLPVLLSPLVVGALALPLIRSVPARTRWLLAAWAAAFLGCYAFYFYTHETWWYLRFLLPAVPALVVAALLAWRALGRRWTRRRPGLPAGLWGGAALLVVGLNSWWWTPRLHALEIGAGERKYGAVARWLGENVPANSISVAVQASGALHYYTDYPLIRWDQLGPRNRGAIDSALQRSGRPVIAVLFPFESERDHVLEERLPGHWHEVGAVDDVTVWRRVYDTSRVVLEGAPAQVGYAIAGPEALQVNPATGDRVQVRFGADEWWPLEHDGPHYWHWARGAAAVVVHNPLAVGVVARASFGLATPAPTTVSIRVGRTVVWQAQIRPAQENRVVLPGLALPPGDTELRLESSQPPGPLSSADPRACPFSVGGLELVLAPR